MKSDSAILTIAITTYNRAAKLQAQLERLAPQLTTEVRLCVYDNASPDNTQEVVAKFLPQGASYFRAITNCGAHQNFFRCLEGCSTEWLWILCDDDLATTTTVTDLLAVLRQTAADFVHASSWSCSYSRDVIVSDLPTLFQHSNISALMWTTSHIYRMKSVRPLFRIYSEATSTRANQFVIVAALLESSGGKALLSPVKLTVDTTAPIAWSTADVFLRISTLPDFIPRLENQRLVAERIYLEFFNPLMLMGLRDTGGRMQILKWQRIYSQVRNNLKAYGAHGPASYVFWNWYRAGSRKTSLQLGIQTICLKLLSWCPERWFHKLAGVLPLPKYIRDDYYGQRHNYEIYE